MWGYFWLHKIIRVYYWWVKILQCRYMEHGLRYIAFHVQKHIAPLAIFHNSLLVHDKLLGVTAFMKLVYWALEIVKPCVLSSLLIQCNSLGDGALVYKVCWYLNTLRPTQNWRYFTNDIALKFVPKVWIDNIPALVKIMAWHRPGDKPLSQPVLVSLLTHICITRT